MLNFTTNTDMNKKFVDVFE